MPNKKRHPSWGKLYFLLAILFGLFLVETRLTLSQAGHRVNEIGIVLLIYGCIWLWLDANDAALVQEERAQGLKPQRQSIRKAISSWLAATGIFRS
jgi:hypothetical protein